MGLIILLEWSLLLDVIEKKEDINSTKPDRSVFLLLAW